MRDIIAVLTVGLGCVLALAAVGFWMHFVWSFDWGHFGSRSWGFAFFVAFLLGSFLIGLAIFALFFWLATVVKGEK
jgi:hypothetical protein